MTAKTETSENIEDGAGKIKYNYDEAVEMTGHGVYNYLLLITNSIISVASALDMFGFSVVVAAASCDLQLGIAETGLLASAPFTGILFLFPWGYYADTRGRRQCLIITCTAGFILAALSSLSPTWQIMLALKFIGSTFTIAAYSTTIAYLGECTGQRHRKQFLFIMTGVNQMSEIVSFALALFILPLSFNIPMPFLNLNYRSWRLFTFVLSIPFGIGAILLIFLYESPKFLASNGRQEEALKVLNRIYELNGGGKEEYPVQYLVAGKQEKAEQSFLNSFISQTIPVFKPPLLKRTIQLCYLLILSCTTNNVFLVWFPTMVNMFFKSISTDETEEKYFCERIVENATTTSQVRDAVCDDTISLNTIYSGIIYGAVFTVMVLAISSVASRRKMVLIVTFLVSAASTFLTNHITNPVASLIFYSLIQSTVNGIGVTATYFVDLYPTSYRCIVTSIGIIVARIASFTGVNLIGAMLLNYCSLTFYGWTAFILSGIVVSAFLPPDGMKHDPDGDENSQNDHCPAKQTT